MKYHFHEARPEDLSDEDWFENIRRLEYLADKGVLGLKRVTN